MDRVARRIARRAQDLRSEERGAFLVETIVAAVLVAVIAVAMLSAFDGANQASARTKMRAIAGSLAQTDQERMRSMPVSMLSGLIQTQTKTVNGVSYTVDSNAEWLADDASNPNCTANGNAGDYLEITSSVSTPSLPSLRPVVVKSIVTPAPGTLGINQGSLAVTVVDRTGKGVQGLTVTITGPTSASDITDQNGCAFFGYEPLGTYNVTTTRANWVDVMGRPSASTTASIASQQVSSKSLTYDLAGLAQVTFATHATDYPSVARDVQPPDATAVATRIRVSQAGMETPNVRDGAAPLGSSKWGSGNPQTEIDADKLFPFGDMTVSPQLVSPYRVWAGDCDSTDPNSQTPSQTSDTVQIEPGKSTPVTVWLPALNIHVTQGGATTPLANADVKITSAIASCGGPWIYKTNAAGNLDFPGLPYGSYNVCVDDNKSPSHKVQTGSPIANSKRTGTAVQSFDIPTTTAAQGSC